MKSVLCALALLGSWGWAGPALALAPGDSVENFRLLDQGEKSHELYGASDRKAIVLMIQGNGCPIVRQALPALAEIREKYQGQGVEFLLLNSNLQDTRDAVVAEAAEFGIEFPILLDDTQLIGEALGVQRTAEVFVIDPKGWTLVYRGPLDDRLSYERQKPVADHHYLRDALEAVLAGRPVPLAAVDGVGCLVNFPEREQHGTHAKISYAEQIAPLLIDRCVRCHQGGAGGPWAMTRYEIVRGFAPRIREIVRTQPAPPGSTDPHDQAFERARALGIEQRRTLVHWIEAGAPRGPGDDPLRSAFWSQGR